MFDAVSPVERVLIGCGYVAVMYQFSIKGHYKNIFSVRIRSTVSIG